MRAVAASFLRVGAARRRQPWRVEAQPKQRQPKKPIDRRSEPTAFSENSRSSIIEPAHWLDTHGRDCGVGDRLTQGSWKRKRRDDAGYR